MPDDEDDPRLATYEKIVDAILREEDAEAFMEIWNERNAPAPEVWKRALDKAVDTPQP